MIGRHPTTDQIRMENVLSALGNPIRLIIAQVLAEGGEHACGAVGLQLGADISKSTLTHHWRVLRDSGVIRQRPAGRETLLSLRREDLDARYPGLLDSILDAAAEENPVPHSSRQAAS
ncbi:helix-turn-helix transcriptional regulator [Amycolatopsis sp. NPDC051071]|uniref:ArsR/SmtB family transcription factor n=1 Tax=Amycolatopsis sp. NPDC051071 TaxID=3154637 RepID=UPI00341C370C